MAAGTLTAVPASCRDIVQEALSNCFGRASIEAISVLAAGASAAAILRVDVGGRSHLLRLEGRRQSPLRYPDQYAALRMAAEAGLGPRVHYIDEQAGVAITDFIEARPLRSYPGGMDGLAHAIGRLLGRVHAAPPVPPFVTYPEIVGRLFEHVRRTGLFAPGVLDPPAECLDRLREAYSWSPSDCVSCHNDSVPSNILFDGERLWLIDWESAYPNDPLVDIAIQLDNLPMNAERESLLMEAWLGRTVDGPIRERLGQSPKPTLLCRCAAERVCDTASRRSRRHSRCLPRSTIDGTCAWQALPTGVHER